MQTVYYRVKVTVPDQPILDEVDKEHLQRVIANALFDKGWGLIPEVEQG